MNILTIKRNGAVLHTVTIDKSTIVTDRLMVEHTVTLNVTLPSALDLAVGDYVEHNGERYSLLELPEYSLRQGAYSYSNVVFSGSLHQLSEWFVDDEGQNEYYYNGTLSEHIDWVLAIINSKDTGWTAVKPSMNGIDQSPRNINYGGCSCLGLLQKLCDKDNGFSIEFDIRSRVITFEREIRRPTNISFSYGRGNGLYVITRGKLSGDKIVTRLYGYGGSQNVANGKRLSFDGKYVERNVAKYGLKEDRVTFDHIYPRLNTSITSSAVQKAVGSALWQVTDTTLTFDLNGKMENSKISFNTGLCAGIQFEITAYDLKTHTITFREYVDDSQTPTYTLPRAERSPLAGDKYVLIDIVMPDEYTAAAKVELKDATVAEIVKRCVPQHPYTVDCDPRYFKSLGFEPRAGDICRLVDTPHALDADVRIAGVEYPLINKWDVKLTVSDKIPIPTTVIQRKEVEKATDNIVILAAEQQRITRSSVRARAELINMVFDPEDGNYYSEKIKPNSIETQMLATGAKSTQFVLQNTVIEANYKGDPNQVNITGGKLVHLSIAEQIKEWILANNTITGLVATTAYYIYAKCQVEGSTGSIILTTDKIKVNQDLTYYHFMLGVLNSVVSDAGANPARLVSLTYGASTISGRFIRTGRIESSGGGGSYFDLDTNRFRVGTASRHLSYNEDGKGGLVLRGSMTISPSGDKSPLPVWRGAWSNTELYYAGDEVTYVGSTYRCKEDCPSSGIMPINTTYWSVQSSKGEPGKPGDVGDSITGKMLYRDPEFRKGVNGCALYDNSASGNATLSRVAKSADCPTTSTHCLEIRVTGEANPGYAGFYQKIQARANAVFLQKFIAKVPVGYELNTAHNAIGNGSSDKFITPNVGTGKYETYLRKTVCGATGDFIFGGHIYLSGSPIPTSANPLVWQVASCTCYDLTDSEKYDDAIEKTQADTDRANALLADIANDDKLIPSEKSTTRSEWEAIINERANLVAQFNLYSIDHTQYDLNYTSLAEYLAPLLSSMSVTSDIIGSTFRSKFNNYYYERQLLLYRVSAAAKNETLESLAQNKATKDFVDILQNNVNKELLEVNKRLDGVIDSYFETYDPTLTNLPASEWVADKDKESHLGDTFTNKATGNSWKWKIIGGVWQWVEITDTIEKELLKKIASAQDTADSKRRNFVSTPTTPYDIGDTWSAGVGSDLMRCISARVSGAFVATDWDKATKYTDDTKALEALAESNKANAQLAEIASDGKLTPSEKQQTAIEWSRIRAEQSKNTDTATTLHVSTGEVLAAFNTLNSYITPLLANLSVTSDINGGQFRATFAAWYEKNIALVNAISKANADKAAGEIEIGGVNLISNSRLFAGTSSNPWAFVGEAFFPEKGRTYTFSFKNTGTKPVAALISNKNADGTSYADITSVPISPGAYGFVTNVTHDASPYIEYGVYTADGGAIGAFSVEFCKLEVGTKATAWSLSPDDVAAAAAADAKAKSDAALATSKTYAEAQKALAETNAAAYADGKVTAEEERAIADATAKANEAREAAIAAAAADAKAKLDLAFADRNFITKIPTIVAAGYHDLILSKQFTPVAGDVYRLSFVCSADSYTPSRADLYISYNNKQGYNSGFSVYFSSYVQGTYTNKVVSLEVRIPSDFGSYKSCMFVNLGGNYTFSARDLKLKLGNVTTDYTLAPEDIIDGIDKKNEVNIINTRKWWYDGGRGDGVYYTLKPSDRADIFGQILTFKIADASIDNFGSIYLFQVVDNRYVQIGYSSALNDPLTAVLAPSATELQVSILRASGNSGRVGTPNAAILVKGRTAPADWSPAPSEIDSAMDDLSKTFGFNDIATLSEWLAKYPGNVPFLSDPATNQTFLSNAIVKRLAVDTAFINELMANEAFVGKLTVGSLNTKPSQQTNRVEIKEDAMTVYDASNRAVSTFNGSPMPALSEFEQDGASGSMSGGSFAIQSAANPGATRTVCSLSVTRNNASLRVQSSISLIFNHIGNKPLVGEAKLELWRGGSRYTDVASAIDETTISVDRSVNVEAGDYSLVLRCIRWSAQFDSEIRGYVGSTTMSFAVADDALKTMFGANGYGVRANKFSYEHTVFNPSTRRLEKTYKGDLNMSGVLAKAYVDASSQVSRRWGKYGIDGVSPISGAANKRVWHIRIAGEYSAFCSAYGGGTTPIVHYEGPDYVDVYADCAFNIMLVGSNE